MLQSQQPGPLRNHILSKPDTIESDQELDINESIRLSQKKENEIRNQDQNQYSGQN